MKKPCEPRHISDTQVDDSPLTNDTSKLNMALIIEGNNDRSSSSWLSLDSSIADNPVLSKTKLVGGTVGEAPASRNFTIGKAAAEERHSIDMVQHPSLGSLAFATPRKPRKRFRKSNANSNIGLTVERSSHGGNHKDG